MDESDLLVMMRRLGYTHNKFASEIGVSTRTFDRYIANGVPKRIMNAANWVYIKEIGRKYTR